MQKPDKNIVLIGMRGTGKSAVGRILADHLGWQFIDIDRVIEEDAGVSIPELIRAHDWGYFRDLESQYAARLSQVSSAVISTGGGVILRDKNITALKKTGTIVLLKSSLAHMQARVARSTRPSLTGDDPAAELAQLWQDRRERYAAAADVTVTFDFETKNKKTDLIRKSKMVLDVIMGRA